MPIVLAQTDTWPTTIDLWLLAGYLLVIVGLPVAGYVLFVVDLRAHYRKLRGALVLVSHYAASLPAWVLEESRRRQQVPACLAAFDLELPCTEAELLDAYRQMVKTRHPDLGGDREEFLQLQRYFEEARSLLASAE